MCLFMCILFRASVVAQMVKNLPAMQEIWVFSLHCEDPFEKGMGRISFFFRGEFYGQRSLVARDITLFFFFLIFIYLFLLVGG